MEIRNHIYKFEVDNKETGKYIKSLRKEKGWTAEVLAEKLYCSPKTVSSWETGVRMPSLDMLVYLSELFDVSVHSLMLPLDNCPCETAGYDINDGYLSSKGYMINISDDSTIEKIFLRKEYLLQKIMYGELSEKENDEFLTIINSFTYWISEKDFKDLFDLTSKDYASYEFLFYKLLIEHEAASRILAGKVLAKANSKPYKEEKIENLNSLWELFLKMFLGDDLSKTILSMGIIEKSVFLTTALVCKNTRKMNFARQLYNSGALFIKGMEKIPARMILAAEKLQANDSSKNVFNKNTHVDYDAFNYIMSFINSKIINTNFNEFEELFIKSENKSFEEYVEDLAKRGK